MATPAFPSATPSSAFSSALDQHRRGQLDVAQRAYEQIIESASASALETSHAQHWLGVLHLQQQRPRPALQCFEQALAITPAHYASQLNMGHALLQLADTAGAARAYTVASSAPEADIAAAAFAAIAHLHMLSVTTPASAPQSRADSLESMAAALAALDQASALQPDNPAFHDSRGSVLHALSRYADAEQAHRTALLLHSAHPGFHNNIGLAVKAQGRLDDAIWHFRDALRLNPTYLPALINLGQAVALTGDFDQASAPLSRAVSIAPDCAPAHQELGNVMAAMADYPSALTHYAKAVALDPHSALALQNLGAVQFELGDVSAARRAFENALLINPALALARFNLASIQLAQGDWEHGWAGYEARQQVWQTNVYASTRSSFGLLGTRWRGSTPPHSDVNAHDAQGYFPLCDKTILIYAEQGLGDTIQFFRFCGSVAMLAEHVIVTVQPTLCALLEAAAAAMAPNITVRPMTAEYAENTVPSTIAYTDDRIDCHCSLLSLPLALGINRPQDLFGTPGNVHAADTVVTPPYIGRVSSDRNVTLLHGWRAPPRWSMPPQAAQGKARKLAGRLINGLRTPSSRKRALMHQSAHQSVHRSVPYQPHLPRHQPSALGKQPADRATEQLVHRVGLAWSGKIPTMAELYTSSPSSDDNATQKTSLLHADDDHRGNGGDRRQHRFDKRAIPLAALQPLFDLPHIEWHVMQTEINDEDAATLKALEALYPIVLRSASFENFADTADAMSDLDHLVSIDTSVAHLGAAMGWPVSLILPFSADWRWANVPDNERRTEEDRRTATLGIKQANLRETFPEHGAYSYWYPSIRMFSQTHRGDWAPVVEAVARSLRARFAFS